jgi:hypothetical protein
MGSIPPGTNPTEPIALAKVRIEHWGDKIGTIASVAGLGGAPPEIIGGQSVG